MRGFEGLLAMTELGVKITVARGLNKNPYVFQADSMTLFLDPHLGLLEGLRAAEKCLPAATLAAEERRSHQ